MHDHQIPTLRNACDAFGVALPARIVEADAEVSATADKLAEVRAEVAPDPESLTVKGLRKLHAEMVAWPEHDARVRAADKLAAVAAGHLRAAWSGFTVHMLEAFRQPFDDAVARYLDGDAEALEAVHQLADVRDILASAGRRAVVRSDLMEEGTRLLTVPDNETVVNRVQPRTRELGRLSPQWIVELMALGCTIKWQTPDEQEAADRLTPSKAEPATTAA